MYPARVQDLRLVLNSLLFPLSIFFIASSNGFFIPLIVLFEASSNSYFILLSVFFPA